MKTNKRIKKIKCPIFHSKNEDIGQVVKAIGETESLERNALLAQKLLTEVEQLLSCEYFDKKRPECKTCRHIANLYKTTAQSKLLDQR